LVFIWGLPQDKVWYIFGACHGIKVGIYLGLATG
jgi:hypothetical protein